MCGSYQREKNEQNRDEVSAAIKHLEETLVTALLTVADREAVYDMDEENESVYQTLGAQ